MCFLEWFHERRTCKLFRLEWMERTMKLCKWYKSFINECVCDDLNLN